MIESQSSDVNPRVKRFVRHVILAAKKHEEREKAKESLSKQIEKVKTVAVKKPKKIEIEKELKKLEKKLNQVLEKEGNIISKEKAMDESIKAEIKRLESQINELKKTDVSEMLVNQIRGLEHELRITESAREKEATENKFEIEQTTKAILDMRERFKQYVTYKKERDNRMEEIEKKIKEKVGKNYDEILKLEKQIDDMEKRYGSIKEQGKTGKGILKKIEDRIKLIKQRLIMRRAGIGAEETKFIPTIKKQEKKKRPLFKKKSIPMGPIKFVKHDLRITPVKEKELMTSGKLPPIPPGPPMPPELEELRKEEMIPKKGILQKIEDFFKKKPENLPVLSQPLIPAKIEK